jgi:hypothetical protein
MLKEFSLSILSDKRLESEKQSQGCVSLFLLTIEWVVKSLRTDFALSTLLRECENRERAPSKGQTRLDSI